MVRGTDGQLWYTSETACGTRTFDLAKDLHPSLPSTYTLTPTNQTAAVGDRVAASDIRNRSAGLVAGMMA